MTPSQAQRSEATRAALIGAAFDLFAQRGYAEVATEEVVRAAGVTRGALYHHFADKQDLFRAVFEDAEQRFVGELGARLAGVSDPWELLVTGVDAFLDHCLDPAAARISLSDAPGVLGWAAWREIDARYGLGLIVAALTAAMDAGVLAPVRPVEPLAHLLLGAMGEAGLMIADAPNPRAARDAVRPGLIALLEGLRA